MVEVFQYEYKDNFQTASLTPLFFDDENVDSQSVYWFFNFTTDAEVEPAREGFTFVNEEIVIEPTEDECVDV